MSTPQTLSIALDQSTITFNPSGTYVSIDSSGNSGLTPTFLTSGTATAVALPLSVPTDMSSASGLVFSVSGFIFRGSAQSSLSAYPFKNAFGNNAGSRWSTRSGDTYDASGVYLGTKTTVSVSGFSYPGEWAEVEFPAALKVASITLSVLVTDSMPRLCHIMGSNTGVSGSYIHIQSYSLGAVTTGVMTLSSLPRYKVVRIVFEQGGFNGAEGELLIDNINFTLSQQQQLYLISQPGSVVFTATQSGNTTYAAATPVSQILTVTQASQTIAFTLDPSTIAYNPSGIIVSLSGYATSNLSLTYQSLSGVSFAASVSGATLDISYDASSDPSLLNLIFTKNGDTFYESSWYNDVMYTKTYDPDTYVPYMDDYTLTYTGSDTNLSTPTTSTSGVIYGAWVQINFPFPVMIGSAYVFTSEFNQYETLLLGFNESSLTWDVLGSFNFQDGINNSQITITTNQTAPSQILSCSLSCGCRA